jgi:Trk-type K+ transport system membrane component
VSTYWAAGFLTAASFANAGFSPFADNAVVYQAAPFPLLLLSYASLVGSTAFPVVLWLIVKVRVRLLSRFFSRDTEVWQYLLQHPRRCYTHLFTPGTTLWLGLVLIVLNVFQFAMSLGFNWNRPVIDFLPPGLKIVNEIFMAITTRTTGFTSVNFIASNPGVLVMVLVMMYIGTYPVVLVQRSTREEVWQVADENARDGKLLRPDSVRGQARRLVLRDAACLFIAFMVIALIETTHIEADPNTYGLFKILFEVISGYGTVGLSLPPPTAVVSLSGFFYSGSKIIITFIMLMGRHRGLPHRLDTAIHFRRARSLDKTMRRYRTSLDMEPASPAGREMKASLELSRMPK